MKTEREIRDAINKIESNEELSFGYREDVIFVLNWILNGEPFDGIE